MNYEDTIAFINSTSVIEMFRLKLGSTAEIGNYFSTGGGANSGGVLWLNTVVKAMTQRQVLQFDYQKYDDETSTLRIVEPYFLKSHYNTWYLLAREVATGSMKVFGLDRVSELQIMAEYFERDPLFNASEYLNNQIGVFIDPNRTAEQIIVKILNTFSNRVKKKMLHHSQQIINSGHDSITISLKVIPDGEFYTEILKLCNHAIIISPVHVRDHMKSIIRTMNDNYS